MKHAKKMLAICLVVGAAALTMSIFCFVTGRTGLGVINGVMAALNAGLAAFWWRLAP